MKIAIITPFGAEERFDNYAEFLLAQGLVRRGDEVRFYTYRIRSNPNSKHDRIYKGVRIIRCAQWHGFAPSLICKLLCSRPDLVIFNHIRSSLNFSAYIASRLIGSRMIFQVVGFLHDPYVVADRDNPLETVYPEIKLIRTLNEFIRCIDWRHFGSCWENYIFHAPLFGADVRITITEYEREMMMKLTGLDASVVSWGVPISTEGSMHKPVTSDGRALPDRFVLFIGQIKKRLGWDTALEAIALLARDNIRRYLVFVTSSSPEVFHEAEILVKTLGIEDRVYFLHSVQNDEKAWLYTHADALLSPSRYVGFGLPVFEAWAAGLPVLGTNIPVYKDFLIDNETSLVSPKDDSASLARNILRLEESGLRERLIVGGKRRVIDFSDERVVQRFLAVILDLMRTREA